MRARWKLAVAIGSALAVGLVEPAAAKLGDEVGKPPPPARKSAITPTWYALALGRLQGRLAVAHYWSSHDKFRAVTMINGKPVLTIVNGPYYYTIDVAARIGIRIERNSLATAADGRYSRPFADEWEELLAAGGEKVREESIAGRVAEVWQLTNKSGRRTVWVSLEKPMVPIRVETYDRKTARLDSVEYVNWQLGLDLPDKFFEPPAGIEMQTFGYDAYVAAVRKAPLGPAPPLYRQLLHGSRQQ